MKRPELDAFAFYLYCAALGVQARDREWWDRFPECRAFYRKLARAALAYQPEREEPPCQQKLAI